MNGMLIVDLKSVVATLSASPLVKSHLIESGKLLMRCMMRSNGAPPDVEAAAAHGAFELITLTLMVATGRNENETLLARLAHNHVQVFARWCEDHEAKRLKDLEGVRVKSGPGGYQDLEID